VRFVIAAAASVTEGRTGKGRIVARAERGRTVLDVLHASSPLRFLRPVHPGCNAAVVCLVSFGGGLVGGDAIDLDVRVEEGAVLVVFTQSSTKVFRGAAAQTLRADVEGTLVVLPDPVAAFAGARYRQRVDVALRGAGSCVLLDGFTSGRAAYGERWSMDGLDLRTTVTRDGRTIVRDALVLDARDGPIAARMDRFDVVQSLVSIGSLDVMAPHVVTDDLVAVSSPLPGGGVARITARSPEVALTEVRRLLGNLAEIGAVDPFASRHGCI
jgi:urease accessory protein